MKVLTVPQIRNAEENAVLNGIFSYSQMMENAGKSAADIISKRYNVVGKRAVVICGKGNNGGDGFVIANELSKKGCFVTVVTPLGLPVSATAVEHFDFMPSVLLKQQSTGEYDFVIDALFGIGLDRTVSGLAASAVEWMNMSSGVKIAVDVPSGIMGDGSVAGKAFCAELTITFIAMKSCLLVPPASDYCGEICVCDIGVPVEEYSYLTVEAPIFKKRAKGSHKGSFGTALLLAGSYGMCGAEILAARAAIKSGVGIVKAAVVDKNYTAFTSSVPEAVVLPFDTDDEGGFCLSPEQIEGCLKGVDAVLVGPGLGQSFSAKRAVVNLLKASNIPVVLDADGINAVSFDINILRRVKAPVIVTPHPGEMARLIGSSVREVEANRINTARDFALKSGAVTVLKGANTVIASPDGRVFINTNGNCGMATAGSGDVLSGITVALLAQGYHPFTAARAAVYVHGAAGDKAAQRHGAAAMSASDIITELDGLFG